MIDVPATLILEEEMATHASILAWRIPWTEAGYSPWGCKESEMTNLALSTFDSEQLHTSG